MATNIQVPQQAWDYLLVLLESPLRELDNIHDNIAGLTEYDGKSILNAISSSIANKSNANAIFRQLVSLHPSPDRDPPFATFESMKAAIEAAADDRPEDKRWNADHKAKWNNLSPSLSKILSLPAIEAFSKGFDLRYEQEHALTTSRIITDLRPIFRTTEQIPKPTAGLITHTLCLRYGTPFSSQTELVLHLALDKNDIHRLRNACDKALAKQQALETFAKQSKLPLIGTDPETNDE